MIRVRVMVPGMDTPYFDGNVKETSYNELKDFLDELRTSFGDVDCEAEVVKPETTEEKDSEEKTDPIAEHIKDHPVIETNDKVNNDLKDFFKKLDLMTTGADVKLLEDLDNLDAEEESLENKDELNPEEFYNVLVNVEKHIISDIYYRDNPEIKMNAVDKSYPVFDVIKEQLVVPVPKTVLEKCTPYNIVQFIKQNTIYMLFDPEYCEIANEDLDKVFTDDFDNSYCYDTGVCEINISDVQFPRTDKNFSIDQFKYLKIMKMFEQMIEIDYREMEKIYISLRKFNND